MRLASAALALLPCGALLAMQDPGAPSTRPAGSGEVSELQEYTRALSKEWLNRLFKIDLDAIGASLRRRAKAYSSVSMQGRADAAPSSPGQGPESEPALYSLQLGLEQYDDILRLQRDPQDIPFALKLEAEGTLLKGLPPLKTKLFLPLSWKDELRAEAVLPMPGLPLVTPLFEGLGFTRFWSLRGIFSNRQGFSRVQAGLGTQWREAWNLSYDYRYHFGQGSEEASHWFRLGREF